ncbi:F-box protein FBW2-like [Prunus avium]|uniref:F-box protein FBW2-like n=1 Tax=Prunus avium TaxID=42229 RepID=A0A6P5T7M2_PRUAV|nr:F-box protein FBW2-like [Prunus avium]
MESLLLDVPFVCKSWYKASLDPCCWQRLIFPNVSFFGRFVNEYRIDDWKFSTSAFIKFVVSRSKGHATVISLPPFASEADLKYVSDVCGDLKVLAFHGDEPHVIPKLIGKWKHLEWLMLESGDDFEEILSQISIHCKDFCGLCVSNDVFCTGEAMAIVNFLPKIKQLIFRRVEIGRDDLMALLLRCKKLLLLEGSDCIGFSPD